jgi:hypothetical protein
MAITKFERWKTSEKNSDDLAKEADGIFDKPIYEEESPAVQLIHDKVHELTDLINEHITKMAANDAKTGITTAQANAIVANTAKDSMVLGTTNKTALAGNTTTITPTQSKAIIDNAANIKTNVTNIDSKLTKILGKNQSLACIVEEDRNGDHALIFMLSIKDEKSGKTIRKTATLQLK